MNQTPTLSQFTAYQAAYDYFNRELFDGKLKPCLLNLRGFSRREMGFFWRDRWAQGEATTHEIALNPDTLQRPFAATMSTLVHEMVHQWQADHGKPPRAGYHDREWAAKMEAVGLVPSNTGEPGGKKTGRQMTHYAAAGGPFLRAMEQMPTDIRLPWLAKLSPCTKGGTAKNRIKTKHTCQCGQIAWGKAELRIICADCHEPFQADAES